MFVYVCRCLFMLNIKSLQAIGQWPLAPSNFISVCQMGVINAVLPAGAWRG